ncbi:hypothetical protein LR48_Vigan04g151700 [Vigna angularis]|uniref:Uncharacterized protein n=1 Tax=Phaseolus angularis TaxID=3914 RepID=A0A0L9UFI9_PHAAN|nr:hypothetical protein LR48_Vigan04g151700 [Vigna angularis]
MLLLLLRIGKTFVDVEDAFDSASEVNVHGWTINNKYYIADVSIWMAHLRDDFSAGNMSMFRRMAALVMVFYMNEPSSLAALREWVSHINIQNFEILLCIGNKVDLVSGHPAHAEYRRRLLKLEDSVVDRYSEEYGISESKGTSLLGDEAPARDIRRINQPSFPEKEELSSEESDYERGGQLLKMKPDKEFAPTTSSVATQNESEGNVLHNTMDSEGDEKEDDGKYLDLEDLEQLMSEIGNMRAGLRLMPDFQRRDMVAKLAIKMASIFWRRE